MKSKRKTAKKRGNVGVPLNDARAPIKGVRAPIDKVKTFL